MKISVKPVKVSHVSIKALLLYEQELAQEYERIVKSYNNISGMSAAKNRMIPISKIKREMKQCQKTREYLEKHYINNAEPEDKTEY
jgi:hypothetical protein